MCVPRFLHDSMYFSLGKHLSHGADEGQYRESRTRLYTEVLSD
jgi:hypothetical protein